MLPRVLVPLLCSVSLPACSHDDLATSSPGDAAESAAPDSGAAAESETDAADSAPAPTKAGAIIVSSQPTVMANVYSNGVSAGFFDGPGSTLGSNCQLQVMGDCWVLLCDLTDGGQQTPTGAAESAGTITIGGTAPEFSLAFDPSTMKYAAAPPVPTDRPIFAGGETITFSASGAGVVAFSDRLVAPAPLVVTSPVLTSNALSVDASKDLIFGWSGSSAGMLHFNLRTATIVASSLVSCQFEASALTGTIPAAMLQKLQKTGASTTGTLTTDHSNAKEVPAGDHLVHLAVGSIATTSDGKTPYTSSQITVF
jgi:hypothetical protein